jgi:hypothetical protein
VGAWLKSWCQNVPDSDNGIAGLRARATGSQLGTLPEVALERWFAAKSLASVWCHRDRVPTLDCRPTRDGMPPEIAVSGRDCQEAFWYTRRISLDGGARSRDHTGKSLATAVRGVKPMRARIMAWHFFCRRTTHSDLELLQKVPRQIAWRGTWVGVALYSAWCCVVTAP